MKRSDIRVLVVEDDFTQGRAILEALRRTGFDAKHVTNPEEALNSARQTDFMLAIVDCMLPRTNGVELVKQLHSQSGGHLKAILTSGIYKDKTFSRNALQSTGALAFVNKPLDLDSLMSLVNSSLADQLDVDLPPLYETLMASDFSKIDRTRLLQVLNSIHGFELPLLYNLLFGSNISGDLKLSSADGVPSILTFSHGKLTQVQTKDRTSYFGAILVEMGFTTPEEIEAALAEGDRRPIGERLVASHSLSPHAIRVVREEQMMIRLSQTVQDQFIDLSFENREVPAPDLTLDRDRLTSLMWDLICSKITHEWLHDFYQRWLDNPVVFADPQIIRRKVAALPGLAGAIEPFLAASLSGMTVATLLETSIGEEQLLPILHFLISEKLAHFGSKASDVKEDFQLRLKRLKRLMHESMDRDYFHLLGVSQKANEKELFRAYTELAKNFHPDRVPPEAPAELRRLSQDHFAKITLAYETLKDPDRRKTYTRELVEGSAEKVLHNESQFEQGQALLKRGKYTKALEIFSQLATQRQHRSDVHIYLAWAKLKVGSPDDKLEKFLAQMSETINRVPPEERHSAPYFYTKGLFYTQIGEFEKAKTNFKHALALDPDFSEARRDLSVVRAQIKEQVERGDLSTVVKGFFSRKKR